MNMLKKVDKKKSAQKRHNVLVSGRVIRGLGGGHNLGFPTMNLNPMRVPGQVRFGIYAAVAQTPLGVFPGVVHYGPRPAVKAGVSFEIHCFDLKTKLYGRKISVTLGKRLRSVKNFPNKTALIKQIRRDVAQAKKYL